MNIFKKIFLIIFIFFVINKNFAQFSNEIYHFSKKEFYTLKKINSIRKSNNLGPVKPNRFLNSLSEKICKKIQEIKKDTNINNTLIIYFKDSIIIKNEKLILGDYNIVGLKNLPHKYNCETMIIIFDKKVELKKYKNNKCPL